MRRVTGFKITARTLFHLGADLISSDAMALYELVKNAFDAGSERVQISVSARAPVAEANPLIEEMAELLENRTELDEGEFIDLAERVFETLSDEADEDYLLALHNADDLRQLHELYSRVNEIRVSDTGDGMSFDDLSEIFLTVGTMSRKDVVDERRKHGVDADTRPILGEKGVGRLSTMRLGDRLLVETVRAEDEHFSLLDLDWTLFSRRPEVLLEEIEIEPIHGGIKDRIKGTTLFISQLKSDWTGQKLTDIARDEFSRLNDPFERETRFPIDLAFNGEAVVIPSFRNLLLEEAHAVVSVTFGPEDPTDIEPNGQIVDGAKLHLRGSVDYRLRKRTLPIDLSGQHLLSAIGATYETLRSLGTFDLKIYWYNRAILEEVDTIGDKNAVQKLVNAWSGGVMVYRDGFRVGGYGSGADDWLGLDRKALASGGYKVNRAQLIGRLGISSIANPQLIDQTNREGLRDSPEKDALVTLLKFVVERVFRAFLNSVDDEVRAKEPVDIKGLAERVLKQRRTIAQTLRLLYERYPQIKNDPELGVRIEEALTNIGEMMRGLEDLGASYNRAKTEMTVLAGIGLSVASIAHELRQVTANALALVDQLRGRRIPSDVPKALAPLGAQLKTLLTRLRVLDPLVTSGRQVKRKIQLIDWIPTIIESSEPVFTTDEIDLELYLRPATRSDDFEVNVVPGMVVQVVGNLLDNARYWVKRQRLEDPTITAKVLVEVDEAKREIRVSDNGPGVAPTMRDTIFDAFVTTKPPGAGIGLGLFISREIANYSNADLRLLAPEETADGMTTTFALRFRGGTP